jgi:hypothetical protein
MRIRIAAVAFATFTSTSSSACPVSVPDAEFELTIEIPSLPPNEARLSWYDGDDGGGCQIDVFLELEALPSRRLVPRPAEVLTAVEPWLAAWPARRCDVLVVVESAAESYEPWSCRLGSAERSALRWELVDEGPCMSE